MSCRPALTHAGEACRVATAARWANPSARRHEFDAEVRALVSVLRRAWERSTASTRCRSGACTPSTCRRPRRKGRTKAEVDEVIAWLTGYAGAQLQRVIDDKADLEAFFANAPRMNPNVGLIKGVVCGVRVEAIADPLMRNIRYLDKLIDELARGKKMESILRVDGADAARPEAGPARAGTRARR